MAEAAPDGAPGIELRHLYKIFGPREAALFEAVRAGMGKDELLARHGHVLGLSDVSLSIAPGRIQVVMGLSGSGKSTLIRHVNRLIDPTAGEVVVGGTEVTALSATGLRHFRRSATAMVFQRFGLLPHRSVLDNVAYGLAVQRMPRDDRHRRADRWIARVGLSGYEDRFPSQLSGGMQQRVGLARALANDAPVLLMDEAFSALDPMIRVDMQTMLLDLQQEIGKTIVFITHDLDEALRLGDRIAILKDGVIVQNGTPEEIVLTPADAYVSSFVREVNRGRVIRLGRVSRPVNGSREGMLPMPASLCLEDAAARLTRAGAGTALALDAAGAAMGCATLGDVVAAMVDRPPAAGEPQGRDAGMSRSGPASRPV